MADTHINPAARWIPLLVVGISLDTLGMVLGGLGGFRWVIMGAGIVMMLVALVKLFDIARKSQ